MKQKLTTFTLIFLFFNPFIYGQEYNVRIEGLDGNITALSGEIPAPCVETLSGEMVAGTPVDGCSPITNPNDLNGKIAVLDRGSCNFTYKIFHAQDAGAIAVIICNNRPVTADGGGVIVMGGEPFEGLNLFAVMISQEQCATFRANLPLSATFTPVEPEAATPDNQILWGNEPGQGDFDGGLNGWTTKTISCDSNSSTIETWKYDPDGILDEGPLSIGEAPGPSFCNGMMAFDSDYLDNEGAILNSDGSINTGAVGTGPCPAPQIGELISPIIDISGSNVAGVSLEFYQETRQLRSQYFIQYSTDGGENYTPQISINEEIGQNEFNEVNKMTIPLLGAAGASQLKVKFIYFGEYYYWLIDDVKIVEREANNLKIVADSFATTPNIRVPKSQVDGINFLADIQNIGASTQENTTLSINVTNDTSGEEVYSDSVNLGKITADSLVENNLLPNKFTPKTEVAQYTGVYTVSAEATDIDFSDNTQTIKFEVTDNEFANEDGTNLINTEITDKDQMPTWSIGNYFYLPKGCGYKISGIGLGIGNADRVGGLEVGIRIFKWTDIYQDSDGDGFAEATPNEREFLGFADYEILGNELTEDINIIDAQHIFTTNRNEHPILLEDDSHYLVMMTMDSEVGASTKDDLYENYLVMNLASTITGTPRYWSFFGDSNDIFTTTYTSNVQNTPLIRMYIAPVNTRPSVNFGADTLIANCVPFTVDFTDSTKFESPITSWAWDFGDGHTSNLQHPVHIYNEFGHYNISLTVVDENGCTETFNRNSYININGNISARDTTICKGQNIDLNTLINETPLNDLEYGTIFGIYDKSNIQTPSITTTFFVRDSNRTTMCVDTTQLIVTVNEQPNITGRDTAICYGQSINLSNLVEGNILNNLEIGRIYNNYPISEPTQIPIDTTLFFFRDSILSTKCKDTTSLTVFVENQPLITGRDTSIMVGQTINLSNLLNESTLGTLDFGTMLGTYGLSNPISPTSTQTFIIRDSIENEVGCKDTAKVVINIPLVNLSLVDTDGNGIPDITDPCNCFDPQNVRKSVNGQTKVTLFHDFVLIHNGGIDQTWVLDAINTGAILQKNGTPFPNNTQLADLGNGIYRLDFWHKPDIGFNASFRRLSDHATETIGNSCQEQACIIIPTFSQWSLFIFGLIVLNVGLILIYRMNYSIS